MISIFLKTSVLILAMLLIRKLFWKACNPNVIYFLWLFVAIRILVPFNIPLTVHQDFLNDVLIEGQQFVAPDLKTGEGSQETKSNQRTTETTPLADSSMPGDDSLSTDNDMPTDNSLSIDNNMSIVDSDRKLTAVNRTVRIKSIGMIIWIIGSVLLALYLILVNIVTYCDLNKTKAEITEEGIQLYEAPGCSCIWGLFKPRILLDAIILDNPKYRKYVLLHEMEHYRTKDNFWLLVKNICVVVQWFNPLVWLAYFKVQEDCELACDNRVLSRLNENEKKDYVETLLSLLEMKRARLSFAASAVNGRTIMEKRIKCIFEKKQVISLIFVFAFMGLIAATAFTRINVKGEMPLPADKNVRDSFENADMTDGTTILYVENAEDMANNKRELCYSTDIYRAGNHYWIDENDILWGTGYSDYGQLGELRQDLGYASEPKRIAENVAHVDYSGEYFMIYLTKDNRLYGMGGNPCGILQESSMNDYNGRDMNVVTEPVLLMENVVYARCGYSTIIALSDNGDVYVLGNNDENVMVNEAYHGAVKVMENARYVTSYFRTYAVISADDSLWTWGDNRIGQCGVGEFSDYVEEPQRVLEDVKCAWMGRTGFDGGNVLEEQDNLVVLKNDGDYYAYGEGIGKETIKDRTSGLDDGHLELANDINASSKFQKIVIKKYEPVSLANVEFFWTESELMSFFVQYDIDYYKEYAEDTNNPVYLANNNQWEFVFDGDGRLVMLSDMKSDEFEKNALSCGDNTETVISKYGDYDRKHDTEYEYFELEYDRKDYIFKVGLYDKFGCAKFSKCVKEYGTD